MLDQEPKCAECSANLSKVEAKVQAIVAKAEAVRPGHKHFQSTTQTEGEGGSSRFSVGQDPSNGPQEHCIAMAKTNFMSEEQTK